MANKKKKTAVNCDVVVVGAGLVGLAAVIAMAEQGKSVVLVDAKPRRCDQTETWDSRIYAITPSTEDWLNNVGVWPLVNFNRVNDVEGMSLWHPDAKAPMGLSAEDANLNKLACIVENKNLMQALWQKIDALNITFMMGSQCSRIDYSDETIALELEDGHKVSAMLMVAADGANSFVRKQLSIATKDKPFNQTALVANYLAEKQHSDIARQWFASHETLALLPLPQQHVSMVWALPTEQASEVLSLTNIQLASRVQTRSMNELGILTPVSETYAFELRQITASKLIKERVVLIGDAAHQVHPMAGQGANLGFRDVMALQKLVANSHRLEDIGDTVFLRQYERVRKTDIISMNTLTSGLDRLFSNELVGVNKLAKQGMMQLNKHASIKRFLINKAVA